MISESVRTITPEELAASLGVDTAFVATCVAEEEFASLAYRRLEPAERDAVILRVLNQFERTDLVQVGGNDSSRWDKGWGQILANVDARGFSEELLRPQYFNYRELRLNGDYAYVENPAFEYEYYAAARKVLFLKYFAGVDAVIEFGCGTGTSLSLLSKLFPCLQIIGCDWAKPSQELLAIIARETGARLSGHWFDMLTLEGAGSLPKLDNAAFMTMHSMEQLGSRFESFLDFMLRSRPRLCMHVEPIVEFYDETKLFDYLAIRYHRKRNYLSGFWPKLIQLAERGRIEIIDQRRIGIGSLFHEGYSLLIWRPV